MDAGDSKISPFPRNEYVHMKKKKREKHTRLPTVIDVMHGVLTYLHRERSSVAVNAERDNNL